MRGWLSLEFQFNLKSSVIHCKGAKENKILQSIKTTLSLTNSLNIENSLLSRSSELETARPEFIEGLAISRASTGSARTAVSKTTKPPQ